MNGETCVLSKPTIHLWHESQQEFDAQKIYRDYIGNSQRSLLSPTEGVKRIPPDTAIHEQMATQKCVQRQVHLQHLHNQCGQ